MDNYAIFPVAHEIQETDYLDNRAQVRNWFQYFASIGSLKANKLLAKGYFII